MTSQNELKQIMDHALLHGAEYVELYLQSEEQTNALISQKTIERVKFDHSIGLGIRLWKNNRVGFGYQSTTSVSQGAALIDSLLANIGQLPEDKEIKPAYPDIDDFAWTADVDIIDSELKNLTPTQITDALMQQVNAAFDYSSLVSICREAHFTRHLYDVTLVNSLGYSNSYEKTCWDTEMALIATKDANSKMKFHGAAGLACKDWNPQQVGEAAAQKSIISLGGIKVPYAKLPVVIHNAAMHPILSMITPAFYAERIDKKLSILEEYEGQIIASPQVKLVNDGRMDGGYFSAPFDGEGTPTQRTTLVDRGILHGFLHTQSTARKRSISSTGNAFRPSFKNVPTSAHQNLFLDPRKTDPESLVTTMSDGFYLYDTIDSRSIDIVSGKVSLNADGLMVRNGKFEEAVSGVSVSADLFDFLKGIKEIANDLTFSLIHPYFGGGFVGSPTVLIKEMTIVGK